MNILNMYPKLGLFLIILSLVSCTRKAKYLQKDPSLGLSAAECINKLKDEGTLIIVIPTFSKKIEHLNKFLNRDKLSSSDKGQIEEHIEKLEIEKDDTFRGIVEGIEEHYSFSDYLFVLDIDMKLEKLKTGKITTINNIKEKKEIEFPSFYMYCYSYSGYEIDYNDRSYFKHRTFEKPAEPFPSGVYVKETNGINNFLQLLGFNKYDPYQTNLSSAKQIQKTLSKFHRKVQATLAKP